MMVKLIFTTIQQKDIRQIAETIREEHSFPTTVLFGNVLMSEGVWFARYCVTLVQAMVYIQTVQRKGFTFKHRFYVQSEMPNA